MKKEFATNIISILAALLATIAAALECMWFTTCCCALLSLFFIYKTGKLCDRYSSLLKDEKELLKGCASKATEIEKELLFYKKVVEGIDSAVFMTTESGYIEWMNAAAHSVIKTENRLPGIVLKAAKERNNEVTLHGKEYSLGCSRIILKSSDRYIVILKNIHNTIERSKVESWHKLVRVLTHEIMNSMTPIISLSETLCESAKNDTFAQEGDSVENMRHGLEIIKRRSSGLLSFVENYRRLTRIAAPIKENFFIEELLGDLRKLYAQEYINFEITSICGLTIRADRAQIEQVFINLLKNAVEACEEREKTTDDYKREIIFAARLINNGDSDNIEFCVSDNGIGLLDTVREQVFVPFFTTKRNGSGIGLSLCKQIITNHDGSIEIHSNETGCDVRCFLPI